MNIGTASVQSRLPVKTIRYYEDIGLVRPLRSDTGYRDFSDTDLQRLKFLQRARSLGFSIEECRELLSLYEDGNRASADVKAITQSKITEIDRKSRVFFTPDKSHRALDFGMHLVEIIDHAEINAFEISHQLPVPVAVLCPVGSELFDEGLINVCRIRKTPAKPCR